MKKFLRAEWLLATNSMLSGKNNSLVHCAPRKILFLPYPRSLCFSLTKIYGHR